MTFKTMPARFPGTCDLCTDPIEAGAEIHYYRQARVARHSACDVEGAPVPVRSGPTTRERKTAKAERLRGWADGREAKSDAAHATAKQIGDMIPLGQPILVGHHSEGRHRRDAAKIETNMRRGVEHYRKAGEMRQRADGIESQLAGSIYSDDADALERLAEKLATLEAERDRVKAFNASARKGDPDYGILSDAQRREYRQMVTHQGPFIERRKGQFPPYVLSNLGGRITATGKRLAAMRAESEER